jgi:hypothetical protein
MAMELEALLEREMQVRRPRERPPDRETTIAALHYSASIDCEPVTRSYMFRVLESSHVEHWDAERSNCS